MHFLIFDYFTKESAFPIPNGFNMSMAEFDSYRLDATGHMCNRSFAFPSFFDIENVMPIPLQSYLSNPKFFDRNGDVYYIISLIKTTRYYNFLFMSGMNSWLNFLNPHLLPLVKEGKVKLVLQIFIETTFLQDYLEIFQYAEEQLGTINNFEVWTCFGLPKPPLEQYFLQRMHDLGNITTAQHESWPNKSHKLIDYPFYEQLVVTDNKETNQEFKKNKAYVSLCRRYTRERLICHAYLIKHNLLDLGYNSIPAIDVVGSLNHDLKTSLAKINDSEIFNECIESAVKYYDENEQGLVLDCKKVLLTSEEVYNTDAYLGFDSKPDLESYYKSSYVSLIQEGDISVNNFMITEKTYRAMLYKHLFVMIGPPYLLESLRSRGYKTFSELWDEHYDTIQNEDLRIKIALDVFKSIITDPKLPEIYERAQDILQHNYELLYARANKKDYIT